MSSTTAAGAPRSTAARAATDLIGGSGGDLIRGGGGDDDIDGRGGADAIFGDAGDDLIHWDYADVALATVDGGTGNDILEIVGTPAADDFRISSLGGNRFTVANFKGGANAAGSITGANFEDLRLDARAGADRIAVDYLAGAGLSFVSLSAGKNVVRTGTELVNDPESGQPVERARFSVADDARPTASASWAPTAWPTPSPFRKTPRTASPARASPSARPACPPSCWPTACAAKATPWSSTHAGGDEQYQRLGHRHRPRRTGPHRRGRQRLSVGLALQRCHRRRNRQRHLCRRPRARRVHRRLAGRRGRHAGRRPGRTPGDRRAGRGPVQRPSGGGQPAQRSRHHPFENDKSIATELVDAGDRFAAGATVEDLKNIFEVAVLIGGRGNEHHGDQRWRTAWCGSATSGWRCRTGAGWPSSTTPPTTPSSPSTTW
jgi:hypothetical protein